MDPSSSVLIGEIERLILPTIVLSLLWSVRSMATIRRPCVLALIGFLALRIAQSVAVIITGGPLDQSLQLIFGIARVLLFSYALFFIVELLRNLGAISGHAQSAQTQFASVVRSSQDMIIGIDSNQSIVFLNPAAERGLGYRSQVIAGRPLAVLIPRSAINELERFELVLDGTGVQPHDTSLLSHDGSSHPVSMRYSATGDLSGGAAAVVAIARDIHDRVALEAEREQARKDARAASAAKDYVLAMASHEFRTPLTTIGGFAKTLLDRWDTLEDVERNQFLGIIDAETDRLTRLVTDLLTVSRIETGRVEPKLVDLEVAAVVSTSTAVAGVVVDDVDIEPRLEVRADHDHLQQILVNLVQNAELHGEHPIRVEAHRVDGGIEIRVADSGPGIAPEVVPTMFDRFTQAGGTVGGTGIGLAICRGLAQVDGGSIDYEIPAEGGAAFVVRLPAALAR